MKFMNLGYVFTWMLFAAFFCLGSCQSKSVSTGLTDEQAMEMAMKWQEANPIFAKAPTDWTNGAYYTGVYKAHQATGNPVYLDALNQMAVRNNWQPWERFYHADDITICSSYLYLNALGVDGVNLQPTDSIIHNHLFKPHEWKDGTNKTGKVILWWWCDALFMAPPVLTAYSNLKNDSTYLDMMHKHFIETYELLYNKDENLFARDLNYVWKGDSTDIKEKNGNKVFWSRGNGWVLGGLALILDQMPANYVNRPFYEGLFKTMAGRIKEIQNKDGLWRTSLLSPETYDHGEVSGSGFFTFALTWGINNGLLDKNEYKPAVTKAWNALRACQQENGMVGWVQNIGASPAPATKDSWQNYGTGAFLLAGSEMIKLNKN
jgi:rhamnogalacturonyl hydrolase YesR